ncbi:MAG: hypothetical protein SGJ00_11630 [bacterium]|nr:hypothetical protein [bacterium]
MKTIRYLILFIAILVAGKSVQAQNGLKDLLNPKYQVSLIMPFCSEQLLQNPKHKNAAISNACRKYYEGFLLALDSFSTTDLPIEVRVYDTKRDSLTLKKILDKKDVLNSDLIIGPVLKEGNDMMVDYCKKSKIYHVSPVFTLTKSKIDNPYLISVYPDLSYYGDFILEDIKSNGETNANIMVLAGKEGNDKILANRIMDLKEKYPGYTFKSIEIGKYMELKDYYKFARPNHVIISSESEFMVGSALKMLSDTNQFMDIQVYGLRKWLEFKAPNIRQLEQLKVKIISPYYLDYTNEKCKLFIEKYRERFFTEPDEYAVTGYEQGIYFLSILIKNHGNLSDLRKEPKNQPLSNVYEFKQKIDGKGIQNNAINILFFEDGRLQRNEFLNAPVD